MNALSRSYIVLALMRRCLYLWTLLFIMEKTLKSGWRNGSDTYISSLTKFKLSLFFLLLTKTFGDSRSDRHGLNIFMYHSPFINVSFDNLQAKIGRLGLCYRRNLQWIDPLKSNSKMNFICNFKTVWFYWSFDFLEPCRTVVSDQARFHLFMTLSQDTL